MGKQWVYATKRKMNKGISLLLTVVLIVSSIFVFPMGKAKQVQAASGTITTMDYFGNGGDGPVLNASDVKEASFGFVMPIFNGGELKFSDVSGDLQLNVKVGNEWVDIDEIKSFVYNSNWGIWHEGEGEDWEIWGYWIVLSKTTQIQLASRANPEVTLEYQLNFTKLGTYNIESIELKDGQTTNLDISVTGGCWLSYPKFNGNASILSTQVEDDLLVTVWSETDNDWIPLYDNAAAGWIYDYNFGVDHSGKDYAGIWFNHIEETIRVKLSSISDPSAYLVYTLTYNEPVRNTYDITANGDTGLTAGSSGAIGLALPKIDGGNPTTKEIDNFVYEIQIDGEWVDLTNPSLSGFSYQGNGYNDMSDRNQWGYWVDGIYGLWFQPITEDMMFRVGYPTDGQKGGSIGNNYVTYTFTGNPNAPRPDISDLGNIELGATENTDIEGWNLIFQDEFNDSKLDTSKWIYDTGHFINDDPSMPGWGNNEKEYYTDSEENVFLSDGSLNLKAIYDPTSFPEIDPDVVVDYSSGKITSKDKFTFKYGRIDFYAKLPKGTGLWPALWLLPNDDTYGAWAASGEIDVMEARGRITNSSSGAIHYGGAYPANKSLGEDYFFKDGESIDTDYHVYSVVWEEDNIKWYVDGECFYKVTNKQWSSTGAEGNENAPFDQEFYIIMNLAIGGWFDGNRMPGEDEIPATMQVDYVRVYQAEGSTNGSYTVTGGNEDPGDTENPGGNEDSVKPNTAAKPFITKQPESASYTYGNKATALSVTASVTDDGTLSYQWYKNSANSTNGTPIAGATQAAYTPAVSAAGITYYYCIVTNTNNDATVTKTSGATSSIAKVEVKKAANNITVTANWTKTYGSGAFSLDAKALQGALTYKPANDKIVTVDKNGKVTIRGCGVTTITITAAGNANYNAATKSISITVKPKKATVSSFKSTKTKKATVKWKQDKTAAGYEIQYSTDKSFKKNVKRDTFNKNGTTSTTLTKLTKGKTYYVRVRATGKNKTVGVWSKAKSVKVK